MTLQAPTRPLWTQCPSPVLLLGGAYAGKSELAIQALAPDQSAVVVGTAQADEPAFTSRLAELRALRPAAWESIDAGANVLGAVREAVTRSGQILIDAVNQWLATLVVSGYHELDSGARGQRLIAEVSELLRVIEAHPKVRFVIVSSEVGGGPAPARADGRWYRQQVGLCNQRLAHAASTVVAVQAGIGRVIKG